MKTVIITLEQLKSFQDGIAALGSIISNPQVTANVSRNTLQTLQKIHETADNALGETLAVLPS